MAITSLTRWATDAVASLPSTAIFGRGLMKDLRADRLQDLLQRGMPQKGRFAADGPAKAAGWGAGTEIPARHGPSCARPRPAAGPLDRGSSMVYYRTQYSSDHASLLDPLRGRGAGVRAARLHRAQGRAEPAAPSGRSLPLRAAAQRRAGD